MLIGGTYTTQMDSEETQERNLQLFMNWTPPEGLEILHHWARADGRGGVLVVEAPSALALLEATAPWTARMDFDIAPLVDFTEAVPSFLKIQEWAKGVG